MDRTEELLREFWIKLKTDDANYLARNAPTAQLIELLLQAVTELTGRVEKLEAGER